MSGLNNEFQNVYQKFMIKENNFPAMGDLSRPGAEFMSIFNSLPNNKVLFDQYGMPGVYVFIPKFCWDPVNGFDSTSVHPAFIWDGGEHDGFWIAKYQNVIADKNTGIVYDTKSGFSDGADYVPLSLPFQDPAVYVDLGEAIDLCDRKNSATMRSNKNIFHLRTNAESAAIALWCKQMWKDGLLAHYCRGNNDYCRDVDNKGVTGAPLNPTLTLGSDGGSYGSPYYGRWRTGSGGPMTAHNLQPDGIFDLNGNIYEWVAGLQSPDANNGKDAFIIPNNEAAIAMPAQLKDIASSPSAPWEKIGEWAGLDDEYFSRENDNNFLPEGDYTTEDAEKLVLIASDDVPADFGNDYFYKPDVGENNAPRRGGSWGNGSGAGLFNLDLTYELSYASNRLGFRSAYVGDLESVT